VVVVFHLLVTSIFLSTVLPFVSAVLVFLLASLGFVSRFNHFTYTHLNISGIIITPFAAIFHRFFSNRSLGFLRASSTLSKIFG